MVLVIIAVMVMMLQVVALLVDAPLVEQVVVLVVMQVEMPMVMVDLEEDGTDTVMQVVLVVTHPTSEVNKHHIMVDLEWVVVHKVETTVEEAVAVTLAVDLVVTEETVGVAVVEDPIFGQDLHYTQEIKRIKEVMGGVMVEELDGDLLK